LEPISIPEEEARYTNAHFEGPHNQKNCRLISMVRFDIFLVFSTEGKTIADMTSKVAQ
jgi:hypothetical protein